MTSLLGMHWLRVHPDGRDLDHVAKMQYKSAKLFEWHWSDRDACNNLLTVLPKDSYILARDHPLSEQEIWSDPVGIGTRHANEWADKVSSGRYFLPTDRSFFLGRNEPDATSGDRNAIDLYTEAFLRRLQQHGLRGGAFNFATGHPRTVDGTGNTQADYSVFERSHRAIVDGHHIAVLHIYGTAAVPCAPGHYDRIHACTWQDVQWVVGECGDDEYVIGGGNHDGFHVPFNGHLNDYCRWLDSLIMGVSDPRIHSFQVFTYDFSHPWSSFDIRPIRDALESYPWQHMAHINSQPSTVHIPAISTGPAEPTPSAPQGDNWARSIAFVHRWEGGYQNNPNDRGNWTGCEVGKGENKGTNFGISACSYPNLDIPNLSIQQADAIYQADYWRASGADKLPWPYCLLVFDTAVLHGVSAARKWQAEVGDNAYAFAAKRLRSYTQDDAFHFFGAGWVNRVSDLLLEAAK